MKPRRKRQRSIRSDPLLSSSTEDEYVTEFHEKLPKNQEAPQHRKSITFYFIRYPILLVVSVLISVNLLLYFICCRHHCLLQISKE